MKKIKWILISILSLIVIYFVIYWLQNYFAKKTFEEYNKEKLGKESKSYLIRCNLNIFDPEFAYTFFLDNKGEISFEKPNNIFPRRNDWENSYTCGTTVKNTTFPQLLEMVKEDCEQFKENGKQDKTTWVYMDYDEEKERERKEEAKIEKSEALERIKNQKPITDEEIRKSKEEWERINKELEEELLRE